MPLPKPRKGEEKNEFIARCVEDEVMREEFPEREQRLAVCYSQWRRGKAAEVLREAASKIEGEL